MTDQPPPEGQPPVSDPETVSDPPPATDSGHPSAGDRPTFDVVLSSVPSDNEAGTVSPTPPSERRLTTADLGSAPPRRRVALPVLLFVATCVSTFWVGCASWRPDLFMASWQTMTHVVAANWPTGLLYMTAMVGILGMHEMGHFLATVRYRVPASFPFFIPMPLPPLGTMGAVIAMDGRRADRRQIFDIGLAGPLAGLAVAVPVLCLGVLRFEPAPPVVGDWGLGSPLLIRLLLAWLRPDCPAESFVWLSQMNACLMAGWVGLLITGLNMMPLSQLDGGHVLYGLLGRRAHVVARATLLTVIALIVFVGSYRYGLMLLLVTLIGVDHPPTSDDSVALGTPRRLLGWASLAIPILCLPPRLLQLP